MVLVAVATESMMISGKTAVTNEKNIRGDVGKEQEDKIVKDETVWDWAAWEEEMISLAVDMVSDMEKKDVSNPLDVESPACGVLVLFFH